METIEILIYLGIAIAAGALVIAFLASQNAETLQAPINTLLGLDPDEQGSERVSAQDFAPTLYSFWQACGFGIEERIAVIGVHGPPDELRLEDVFLQYRQINLCRTISSETFNCGQGESLRVMDSELNLPLDVSEYSDVAWSLPAAIIVRCNPQERQLEVFVDG